MSSSGVYKLDDGKPFLNNCFPAKNLLRTPEEGRGHWLVARKCSLRKKSKRTVEAPAEGQESQKISFEVGAKKRSLWKSQVDVPGHVLDLNFLLKHHCVREPSDLCTVNVSGLKFSKAKEKDFKHFDSVIYINASENLLPLEVFHTFPALKELDLAFNSIETVYVKKGDFKFLEFLDLSFNSLTAEAIRDLGILPHLRVLLLTGNGLTSLPPSLAVTEQEASVTSLTNKRYIPRFPALETLMLDDNKLSNPNCFASLAGLSRLKKLSLDQNRISRIPYLQQVQLRDGAGDWVESRGSPRKGPQSVLQPKSWMFEASDEQPDYTVLPMKKDDDRTEVVFSPYPGFSALETPKVCAFPPIFEILPVKSLKARNQTLAPPFPELRYLSLAYNKIAKEDAILPVALFPSLCELVFHNNPLVAHRKGVPPLLKSFLQERLGIHLIRRKVVKAKHHILIPRKASRKDPTTSLPVSSWGGWSQSEPDAKPTPSPLCPEHLPRALPHLHACCPIALTTDKEAGSESLSGTFAHIIPFERVLQCSRAGTTLPAHKKDVEAQKVKTRVPKVPKQSLTLRPLPARTVPSPSRQMLEPQAPGELPPAKGASLTPRMAVEGLGGPSVHRRPFVPLPPIRSNSTVHSEETVSRPSDTAVHVSPEHLSDEDAKSVESIFLTQVSGLPYSSLQRDESEVEKDQRPPPPPPPPPPAAPREVKRTQRKLLPASVSSKYRGYEELLTARPDPAFTEPKGIQKNTQALQHMLKQPVLYGSSKPRRDALQRHYVPKEKRAQRIPIPTPRKTRAQLLDDILIRMRDPRNITEAPLGAVLRRRTERRLLNQQQYLEAKRLLKEFRARYRELVRCSLQKAFRAPAPSAAHPALSEGQPKFGCFLQFVDELCPEPTANDFKG